MYLVMTNESATHRKYHRDNLQFCLWYPSRDTFLSYQTKSRRLNKAKEKCERSTRVQSGVLLANYRLHQKP